MPQDVVQTVDSKGRNLLLILIRYLSGDLDNESPELKKILEVINILTREKQAANKKQQQMNTIMCDA